MTKWIVVSKTIPINGTPFSSWPDAKFYSEEEGLALVEKRKTLRPQMDYVAIKVESDEI